MTDPSSAWLARIRHDLVKRLLWPARDRRDLGGPVIPGELLPKLVDDEGQPITALALWQRLDEDAPDDVSADVRTTFGRAVATADAGARADELEPVLALDSAFAALARHVKGD
jgi:hypothetical protein